MEASFLAGGEFTVPVAQGSGANLAISVMFKEFGIRLTFTPVVNGDRVHLKVRPEVSTLDFVNAIQLNGFRIPALSTRRATTEFELKDGQSFVIAGLLDNRLTNNASKIPGLGTIPILGTFFKSKNLNKTNDGGRCVGCQTEHHALDSRAGDRLRLTAPCPRKTSPRRRATPGRRPVR